jgi:hypothetical protein
MGWHRAPRSTPHKNALKHGRYTAEAIAERREIATLLKAMKSTLKEIE